MQQEHILFGKNFTLSNSVGDVMYPMGTKIGIFRPNRVSFDGVMSDHKVIDILRKFFGLSS